VETWVYRWLGRPNLTVAGEVLSDPVNDDREIDWITYDNGAPLVSDSDSTRKPLGRLVLRGGCDMSALSHYLMDLAEEVHIEHHVVRDDRAILTDHTAFLRLVLDGVSPSARASLIELGHFPEDWTSALTAPEQPGRLTVWLLSFWMDAFSMLYRHRELGLLVPFTLAKDPHATVDVTALDDAYLSRFTTSKCQRSALEALRRDYTAVGTSNEGFVRNTLRALVKPAGRHTLICILLGPESWTDAANGKTRPEPAQARMNAWIRQELGKERNVVLLDPLDFVGSNQRRTEALHFHRLFYQRVGQEIRDIVLDFPSKALIRKPTKRPLRASQSRKGQIWRQHIAAILSRFGYD
jgi:hypothetical protein